MLILSRRTHQEILFPNLGISLQVLQIRGQIVKIGINAPKSVPIIRREVHTLDFADQVQERDGDFDHRLRNELNLLQLRLAVIQQRLDLGETIEAESTLRLLLYGVDAFDRRLADVSNLQGLSTSRRLLVVEDSDNERKLMAYMLASHGFEVHVARDGAEALAWLRNSTFMPDFVLMDLQMPLANGLEALHQIRHDERLSGLRVFAVTGSKRVLEEEPVGRGWDGWFSKPLDVRQLINCLQEEPPRTQPAPVVIGL